MSQNLEEELQEALAESARKTQLLAHTSHEIRTELSGLIGMAKVMMETRLTPEQSEYMTIIDDSGEAILTLVNDLLDFSKIEAGRLEVERVSFSLVDTLSDTLATFNGVTGSRGLWLKLELDPSIPDRLVGDPGRIRQVVANLVSNAVKFTDQGGVTVRATVNDVLQVEVADTGVGIAPDRQEAIFDSFTQADESTSRTHGGTGLGLSISRQLTEMMGGGLTVTSELGAGSTFRASFRVAVDTSEPATDPISSVGFSDLPVLITGDLVHDESLLPHGFALDRCEISRVAEEVVKATESGSPYALVVIGVATDPLGIAKAIRDGDGSHTTHIMVVSPMGNRGDAALCRELRVAGYLTSPYVDDDVTAAVSEVLHGPTPMDLTTLVTRHWLRERRRRLNVLIVDDSPTIRMATTRMLDRRGHLSIAVGSVDAAAAAVSANRFDAIVLDLHVPNAYELGARLAHLGAPLIGSTADLDDRTRERALASGFIAVLSRPFGVHQLVAAIEESVT